MDTGHSPKCDRTVYHILDKFRRIYEIRQTCIMILRLTTELINGIISEPVP